MALGYVLDVDFIASTDRVDWKSASQKPSQAAINAVDLSPTAVAQRETLKAREAAKALAIRDRAILMCIVDQFNVVRSKLVPALPAITLDQVKTAIRNKIDQGQADA